MKKKQIIAVVAAALLIVLLLLSPRKVLDKQVEKPEQHAEHKHAVRTVDMLKDSLMGTMDASQRVFMEDVYANLKVASGNNKAMLEDSLGRIWQQMGSLELAAHYFKQSAISTDTSSLRWLSAGDAYFSAFRYDMKAMKQPMIEGAIAAYEQALRLDSSLLKAKTSLGVCLVEGAQYMGQAPMKGITMLKEVLAEDPENVDAMVNLGYFAIQSGQLAKARERFEKVLELHPDYAEANLYLADICLSEADTAKALMHLERYKTLAKDSMLVQQVDGYIKELKNS